MPFSRTVAIFALSTIAAVGIAQTSSTSQSNTNQQAPGTDANNPSTGGATQTLEQSKQKKAKPRNGSGTNNGTSQKNSSMPNDSTSPDQNNGTNTNRGSRNGSTAPSGSSIPNGAAAPNGSSTPDGLTSPNGSSTPGSTPRQ